MATLKKTKNGFQDQLLLNAGQKYCRMLQGEHSAIISTFTSYQLSLKPLFCPLLKLSGCFTQVFLFKGSLNKTNKMIHTSYTH